MTTAKLIEMLKAADPDGTRQVYIQRDPEGNGYESARYCWTGAINKRGDVGIDALTESDIKAGYRDVDVIKGKKILIVAP